MITLDGIVLPEDLEWTDEYKWSPVTQDVGISLSGALIIQEQAQQTGRPITLAGGPNASWIQKQTLEQLRAKANQANLEMSLDYHGTITTVMFSRANGEPIEAQIVRRIASPGSSEWYSVTALRLIEVA